MYLQFKDTGYMVSAKNLLKQEPPCNEKLKHIKMHTTTDHP